MWLAPEVLQGQRAGAESDVYAFGLVLFELLAWRLPWVRVSPFKVRAPAGLPCERAVRAQAGAQQALRCGAAG